MAALAAGVDQQRIINAEREPGNWMSHGRTYDEQRYSPLRQVNDGNVQRLGLAWTHKLDVDRGVEATPIVVDGVMYTTGAWSIVYALDAASGRLLWKFDPKVNRALGGTGCCDVVNRGVAVWGNRVFVAAFDGRLIALDARSGKPVWSADTVLDHQRNYTSTGAPRIVKGLVLIGNGGAEFGVRGYVSAYDANSGKLAWRFHTVPGDPKLPPENAAMAKARETWFGDDYARQGGGGTVWDSMAYDPELDLLYVGVGNGSLWNIEMRSQGKGDNLYLSSIVALRPSTGEYVWHYQTTPGDKWDYTATQHMILATLTIDGQPRKVLMQAPKNGFFYVLDRATGALLSAEKFAPVNWATGIDKATGRPIVDAAASDYTKGGKLVFPSFLGAHNWQPMSFSPKTGLVYIPQQEGAAFLEAAKSAPDPKKGQINIGLEAPKIPEDPKVLQQIADSFKGNLLAWDPVHQKAAWSVPRKTIYNGGTLATAGNLVFQGTADGRVTAYAADSGKPLWEEPVNSGVMAGPVTYTVRGEQYVSFMAGWGGTFPLLMGPFSLNAKVQPEARIVTYKLGGDKRLPPPASKPQAVPQPPALSNDTALIDRGRTLYNGSCAGCHGLTAVSGGVLPDLRYLNASKHNAFNGIVAGALANRGMPSFASLLQPDEIDAIHQYVILRAHTLKDDLAGATPMVVGR